MATSKSSGEKFSEKDDFNFGGWESDQDRLRRNLEWTPKQILTWLDEANRFSQKIKANRDVLS